MSIEELMKDCTEIRITRHNPNVEPAEICLTASVSVKDKDGLFHYATFHPRNGCSVKAFMELERLVTGFKTVVNNL